MSDLIKRSDAIKAIEDLPNAYNGWSDAYDKACIIGTLEEVPSADRPRGKVNAVKIYEQASHDLEFGYITLGEFEERTEPLKHLYYDRPRGEWIFKTLFPNDKSEFPMGYLVCSVCGSHHSNSTPCNYCDNCGARMVSNNE